jgi:primosomal protein N' (replication factor Y) (superfamily II helicase)
MARYAEVSVNSPIAQRKLFSYEIPEGLNVDIGQAVWVPFGDKTLQGVVLELTSQPTVEETREIAGVIEPTPLLSPSQVALARWTSAYYLAPIFDSVALMLPPGFERRVITFMERPKEVPELPSSLDPEQKEILESIRSRNRVAQRELEKTYGVRRTRKALLQLVRQHLAVKTYTLEKVRVKPRMVPYLRLKVEPGQAREALSPGHKAVRQSELLEYLIEHPQPAAIPDLKQKGAFSSLTIRALVKKGLAEIQEIRQERDPLAQRNINLSFPLPLTASQAKVFEAICDSLAQERAAPAPPDIFLLHGVTGSGKTEIYIQALQEAVRRGRRGIVLVPEIAMTPQIIERFVSRFPGKVAILHSELPLGEQFDEWWRIKNGEFDVVIGPRSVIFAPQPDLGLIIIDEEHEWTYKQADNTPHYHTREVALKLAELTGATLVLGSATPDIESYYRALNGQYRLLELSERVTPGEGSPLPQIEIVDLKAELKANNLSLFSRSLQNLIATALQNREQVLLFLNRRGMASFVECRDCGLVIRCKRCEVPLSYHFSEETLICHQCNYRLPVPGVCPRCRSRRIKYLGVGTEKLEQEAAKVFPQARLLRWDSDAVQGRTRAHQEIFTKFRTGGADILVGTQMIAKGLDLPGVTVVGVVSADTALNLPDFRAGERTFQLLSQVAGRAGRGPGGGKVVIQTYSPDNYAIKAAAKHDYQAFYQKEMAYRRELHNPPFSRLARLVFSHHNDRSCQEEAERMKRGLLQHREAKGLAGIELIGPAPAFIHRVRGRYRWQLVLRAYDPAAFLAEVTFPRGWTMDIDPVGLI